MQILKQVLKAVWSLWGLVVFLVTLVVVTPLYILVLTFGGENRQKKAHRISQAWARVLFKAYVIRVIVHNKNLLDPDKPFIFVANHASQLDIPAMAVATDHFFKFLAKQELTRIPLLGRIIKQLYLTVDRSNPRARAQSMATMQAALSAGTSVVIFPEGSRNQSSSSLMRFHDGAFSLSYQTGYPLAVLTIVGSGSRLPANNPFQLCPGTLHCYWETILDPQIFETNVVENLKTKAREAILNRLEKPEHIQKNQLFLQIK